MTLVQRDRESGNRVAAIVVALDIPSDDKAVSVTTVSFQYLHLQ